MRTSAEKKYERKFEYSLEIIELMNLIINLKEIQWMEDRNIV